MTSIFVNLKRFEVPRRLGGVCPVDDPQEWIEGVLEECASLGLDKGGDLSVVFFLPEGLLLPAARTLGACPPGRGEGLAVGCQGVHRDDIKAGGNFGAFTSLRPATAARHLGSTWALIGHSEERRAMQELLLRYDPSVAGDPDLAAKASACINGLMGEETRAAADAGLRVLLCVGETAAERGDGDFSTQWRRIKAVLRSQLELGLKDVRDRLPDGGITIAYEPVWAIGPGKTPPGPDYISLVAGFIKAAVHEMFGYGLDVVYGGGLKLENAAEIGAVKELDGGLIALTQFSGLIGFRPEQLKAIIDAYHAAKKTTN